MKTYVGTIELTKAATRKLQQRLQTVPSEDEIDDSAQVAACEMGADLEVDWETKSGRMHYYTALSMINGMLGHYLPGHRLVLKGTTLSLEKE